MKYSTNNIVEKYTKYLLIHSDPDKSIAYLIMYLINEKYPDGVQTSKRLEVVSWIQKIFDTLNPLNDGKFSSFDIELENLPEEMEMMFYNDYHGEGWIRNKIKTKSKKGL